MRASEWEWERERESRRRKKKCRRGELCLRKKSHRRPPVAIVRARAHITRLYNENRDKEWQTTKKKVLSRISTLDVIVQCVSVPVTSMSNLRKKGAREARERERRKTEGEKVIDRYLRKHKNARRRRKWMTGRKEKGEWVLHIPIHLQMDTICLHLSSSFTFDSSTFFLFFFMLWKKANV